MDNGSDKMVAAERPRYGKADAAAWLLPRLPRLGLRATSEVDCCQARARS